MTYAAGIDVGSTYTKTIILNEEREIVGHSMQPTGYRLAAISRTVFDAAVESAGLKPDDIEYTIATGYGRHQVGFSDMVVTDLTASARGARHLFPGTRTILDVGGQTMKASRLDERSRVKSFRLNDKCAAGTGAFLEKTARYMGYETEEIGSLVATSKERVPISGVCAVFAESEVINHLSKGCPPGDIMYGAIISLVDRSVQLMKRVRMEPEFTLVGGILRFQTMVDVVREKLGGKVNVAEGEMPQFTAALGAALLSQFRIAQIAAGGTTVLGADRAGQA